MSVSQDCCLEMQASPPSVLLQMLMQNASKPSVSTLANANACKLATCFSLSTVAWKCRQASAKCLILSAVANAKSAVVLVNMPNKPAKPVISIFRSQWLIAAHCRTEIQIAVAHSSALPNWNAWLVAAHARTSFQSMCCIFLSLWRWKKRSHRGRIESEIRPSPDRMRTIDGRSELNKRWTK